jgi:hypothetical protein
MALTIALFFALAMSVTMLVIRSGTPEQNLRRLDQIGIVLSIALFCIIIFLDPVVGPKVAAFLHH